MGGALQARAAAGRRRGRLQACAAGGRRVGRRGLAACRQTADGRGRAAGGERAHADGQPQHNPMAHEASDAAVISSAVRPSGGSAPERERVCNMGPCKGTGDWCPCRD